LKHAADQGLAVAQFNYEANRVAWEECMIKAKTRRLSFSQSDINKREWRIESSGEAIYHGEITRECVMGQLIVTDYDISLASDIHPGWIDGRISFERSVCLAFHFRDFMSLTKSGSLSTNLQSFERQCYQVFREVPNANQRQPTARRTQAFARQYKSAWASRQERQTSKQSTTSYSLPTRESNKLNVSNPAQVAENPVRKIRIPPKKSHGNQDSLPKCEFKIIPRFIVGEQLLV
jgi:hypothetical protein